MKIKYTSRKSLQAFTLIELLIVITVIAVLAGIAVPSFGIAIRNAKIAASKQQFGQYIKAMEMFKLEYGYYPTFEEEIAEEGDTKLELDSLPPDQNSMGFIETLSGRNDKGEQVTTGGNRKAIAFHSFADGEFKPGSKKKLADKFGNDKIVVVIDTDGDGIIKDHLPDGDKSGGQQTKEIRASVIVYTEKSKDNPDFQNIYSWK